MKELRRASKRSRKKVRIAEYEQNSRELGMRWGQVSRSGAAEDCVALLTVMSVE